MAAYTYIWAFEVRPEFIEAFLAAYGADGDWVRLFRRGQGYVGTRLLRDREDPHRFLTLDTWRSAEDFRSFRQQFAAEFAALDRSCEAFTVSEVPLGEYRE